MRRIEGEVGYELQASEGMELVVIKNSKEVARCKSVYIPSGGTKHTWSEVPEIIPEPVPEPTPEELLAGEIAQTEAKLAELKSKLESV